MGTRQAGAGTEGQQVRVPLASRDSGQAEPQPDGHPASPQQQGRSEARPGNPAGGSESGSEPRKYETVNDASEHHQHNSGQQAVLRTLTNAV